MEKNLFKALLTAGIMFCVLLPAFTLHAEPRREAKIYVVTRWDAGCPGGQRDWWDNMADAWYDEITDSGFSFLGWCLWGHCKDAYSRDGRQVNGNIVNSRFADASVVTWGNDRRHLDEGDAVLVAWHGGEDGDVYRGSMRVNEPGAGDCSLRRDEMEIGDWDLEFLHLSSCHSMDRNQWHEWWQAFDGAHQVDGFHGWMWIGSGLVGDYRDFADDAFDTTIADAWLDNMYVPDIWGSEDQCPVAYGVGRTLVDLVLRMHGERYNNVHSDPTQIGWWGAIYIRGCDPADEDPLPSS